MNKDFSKEKLLSFGDQKIFRILYDLVIFIETHPENNHEKTYGKINKYLNFLEGHKNPVFLRLSKLSKDYQNSLNPRLFQEFTMILERLTESTRNEYDFVVYKKDQKDIVKKNEHILVLDQIRSAHNMGAMIRNAECFGINTLYYHNLSPSPESRSVLKTSMGSEKYLQFKSYDHLKDLIEELRKKEFEIISFETTSHATPLTKAKNSHQKKAFIFGHEYYGLSENILELSDHVISIELLGRKNSLNIACAQAISLHHFCS